MQKVMTPAREHYGLEGQYNTSKMVDRNVVRLDHVTTDAIVKTPVPRNWRHQLAFERCKRIAGNSAKLTLFDAKKSIVLTTDASSFGIEACLCHKFKGTNGKVRLQPIAYASASLKPSERAYVQIEQG